MADVVDAFSGGEEFERGGDERADLIEGARPRGAEQRFQFGEGQFDRIEVGAVGWEKAEMRADRFNRGAHLRLCVYRQIVEDHDVTGS